MVLAGLWFGLAIGFAIWRWSSTPIAAAAMTVLITWIGWEAAINVALQIDRPWPEAIEIASVHKYYITGFMAGAVGAAITWAGVAIHFPALRCARAAATVTATGAVLGLLLPVTNIVDSGWILLLPWQAGVAAIIGLHLPSPQYGDALA